MDNDRLSFPDGGFFDLPSEKIKSSEKARHWNHRWFGQLLNEIVNMILEETGEEGVRGIFLCGSFATGEGTVIIREGKPVLISDIDLVVVVDSDRLHHRILGRRKNAGSMCERLTAEALFVGGISVGVYHISELPSLPPSPLVFDIREKAVTLYGNSGIREEISMVSVTEEEGLRLLENRVPALLGSLPLRSSNDFISKVELAYSISKVYTDILVLILIFQNRYVPGYRARLELAKELYCSEGSMIPGTMIEKIERWTEYKLCPRADGLTDQAELEWEEAGSDLLHYWRVFRSGGRDRENPPGVTDLIPSLKSRYSLRDRIRRWKKFLKELPFTERLTRAVSLNTEILNLIPAEMINREGIRILDLLLERGEGSRLIFYGNGLRTFSGNAAEAAGSLYRLWSRLNK